MELNEIQTALARRAINTLVADAEYAHKSSVIAIIGGAELNKRIAEVRCDYVNANKAAKNAATMLSPDAAEYWREAQGVLAYGRLALAMGSRKAEKAVSLKCEALDESFDARVPSAEKGMFIVHDINGSNWDDRWHACVDFNFPLLREQSASIPIKNTLGEAQLCVLSALVPPESEPEARAVSLDRFKRLRDLARGEQAVRSGNADKRAKAAQRKADHAAKVAAGDQKATRGKRAKGYRLVAGVLTVKGKDATE